MNSPELFANADFDYLREASSTETDRMLESFVTETAKVIPIQSETPTMFNPEDASSVSKFFQMVADKIVLASTLPKEVEELRQMVTELRNDVEMLRATNQNLVEQVATLRSERQTLQDENASLRSERDLAASQRDGFEGRLSSMTINAEDWHNSYINIAQELEDVKRLHDNAQLKILELNDLYERVVREKEEWREATRVAEDKLNSIRGALAA